MEIRKISVTKLKPAAYNPRQDLTPEDAEYAKLEKSIDTFGLVEPIVWNKRTGNVVGGHQRLKILLAKGAREVTVSVVDLDDEHEKALNLALNKVQGRWDEKLLAELFSEFEQLEYDLSCAGFDPGEVEAIMESGGADIDDFFAEPDAPKTAKPRTCPGSGDIADPPPPKAPYRLNQSMENFFKAAYPFTNQWGIPEIAPCTVDMDGVTWVDFNNRHGIKDHANTALHFYIEDYQFNVVWTQPDKYLSLFKKVRAVVTPDFSMYTDMPPALQLYNAYRRQWLGRYWQENGVNVICSLSWAMGQARSWAFAGIPQNSMLAHSFVGSRLDTETISNELQAILVQLKPALLFMKVGNTACERLRKTFDFVQIPPYVWKTRGKRT